MWLHILQFRLINLPKQLGMKHQVENTTIIRISLQHIHLRRWYWCEEDLLQHLEEW